MEEALHQGSRFWPRRLQWALLWKGETCPSVKHRHVLVSEVGSGERWDDAALKPLKFSLVKMAFHLTAKSNSPHIGFS